nr:polysaccharide pyruvyl transferase family protein [Microbacterium testaceum]
MTGPRLFHWNPRSSPFTGRIGERIQVGERINNFGDLLGPEVVRALAPPARSSALADVLAPLRPRLFSVGSVLHFTRTGDHVWGTGWNGKIPVEKLTARRLRVHAVRGPLTRATLRDRGIDAPEVYGDPALLLPDLYPQLRQWRDSPRQGIAWLPNLNDAGIRPDGMRAIDPREPLWRVLEGIAVSDFVVASSLHGIILADALGIPARLVLPQQEPLFKYEDYFEGTGRILQTPAQTPAAAVDAGPHEPLTWSSEELVDAFPRHLFP